MPPLFDGMKPSFQYTHFRFDGGEFLIIGALCRRSGRESPEDHGTQKQSVSSRQIFPRDYQTANRKHILPFLKSAQYGERGWFRVRQIMSIPQHGTYASALLRKLI
ncbi:hypothetical protein GKA01_20880 [Gluconobacter kanchanaburiensis NBRC 103587]|uniref:Uncharacterized protein n=1 Tax=Gluconobacter kanchanaburiensis NBRC 103587 TaxID=1307948 RepID=A0A511BAT1_9PROT|nr:hypothetical protein GKA01_20880 [Gluconobacter kanchanaburiensis NBRC 103587]